MKKLKFIQILIGFALGFALCHFMPLITKKPKA